SDLTFGLELAFTAPAWYFGLRGLYEGRIRYWIIGTLFGALAILSKEPALVLAHCVMVGSALLSRDEVREIWSRRPSRERAVAIAAYGALTAISLYVILASPTRSNRFFGLSTPNLPLFVRDRIDYYSSVYLAPGPRVLVFFPIVYATVRLLFT